MQYSEVPRLAVWKLEHYIMSKRWPLEESSLNMATELNFRTIWPRFTRLSSNNTSFLNRPSYKSKLSRQMSSAVYL